ncbi:MAG: AbrB/MazE/SpoVT family DNA-binding domain-containing protein [Planctomycetota bacterium]
MPTVKIGFGRQVVIPKEIHDQLGLAPGDRLDVSLRGHQLVFTPTTLVDKRIGQALADERAGRVRGPFKSADEMLGSLATRKKKTRKRPAS